MEMHVGGPKQIVYRYEGEDFDEIEFDATGEQELPTRGEVIMRRNRAWRVAYIADERAASGRESVPMYRVYLLSGDHPIDTRIK